MKHDIQEYLNCPMEKNDSLATTVRGYLKEQLHQLWILGEGFSGKRPFGNSDWEVDVWRAWIKNHLLVDGFITEEGYAEDYDTRICNRLIHQCISAL